MPGKELSTEQRKEVKAITEKFLGLMREEERGTGLDPGDVLLKPAKEWYVGVTENLVKRLTEHYITDSVRYDAEHASCTEVAREVERVFVHEYGTSGGTGGGENPDWVYIYKKVPGVTKDE